MQINPFLNYDHSEIECYQRGGCDLRKTQRKDRASTTNCCLIGDFSTMLREAERPMQEVLTA